MEMVAKKLSETLPILKKTKIDDLLEKRFEKFRLMGNETITSQMDSINQNK
jgi:acetyl-CoA carboxylase alpha subunit